MTGAGGEPEPCPPWCVSDHAQDSPGSALWCHRTAKVVLAKEIGSGPERFCLDFQARTVQYPHARPRRTARCTSGRTWRQWAG